MKVVPRYPVYVISKGRHDCCKTARFLAADGIPFRLAVEPQEADLYAEEFPRDVLLVTPFSNLGQGSIPVRNFVWEHSIAQGAERHWVLDDNIRGIWRRYRTKKVRCDSGPALACLEDFADRYENLAIAGLNYYMFGINGVKMPAFYLNVHVYSCILISNGLPFRWRGRYNEDTDLCLQALSAGLCTVLLNVFLAWKETTMTMKGGNMTELYKGDGRLRMARDLKKAWPHVVDVKRRFGRPQHVIKDCWKGFTTPLKPKPGIEIPAGVNNYGLSRARLPKA